MAAAFSVDAVFPRLNNKDKAALLSGIDFWHTHPIPRLGIPSIRVSDGPNGIRGTKFFAGVPAACLPCGTALGATWDKDLLFRAGELLGQECISKGANCWLGPTVNIQRSPLGGRGFESYSEDPFLSGKLACFIIKGCESKGIIACVKHFVANDQEHERRAVDTLVTARALREVYLRPFQIVARDAKPGTMMTSYNKLNGVHVSEDPVMLEDIVRKEWNWDPLLMSDWFGTYSSHQAINAGLDLEMPGPSRYRGQLIDVAVSSRLVKQSTLDKRARKVLEFVERASRTKVAAVEGVRDTAEDRALNRELCATSIVVLRNDANLLPLPKKIKKIALLGSHTKIPGVSGGGSAGLEPYYAVSLYDAITEKLSSDVEIVYEPGAYAHMLLPVIDRLLSNSSMKFYNEPRSVEGRKLLGEEFVRESVFQLMDYNNIPALNRLFYVTFAGDFTPDISGIWQFGCCVFGTADVYIDDELIIDNSTKQKGGSTFFGKGTVEEMGKKSLVAGQVYKIRVDFGGAETSKTNDVGVVSFGGGACRVGACLDISAEEMVDRAIAATKDADFVVLCTGLNKDWECEGYDRQHMDLPPGVDDFIAAVLRHSPHNTILVNQSGTPVTMPWEASASTIVQAWYGGNETGNGIADILFGDVEPSAKLPLSWPISVKQNPAYLNYKSVRGRVMYGEDVYAGWKYYEAVEQKVLFPFGHGLSYTSFSLRDLAISNGTATVTVTNTGKRPGAEIVQLYVAAPNSPTPRPKKELHGFEKIFLQPGEGKRIEIAVDAYATSYWDEIEDQWRSEAGVYKVLVGRSSVDPDMLKAEFEVEVERLWLGL